MADAAAFVMRSEAGGGLPWNEGTFTRTFITKEHRKEDEALEGDAVASKIISLSESGGKGTMKELLSAISDGLSSEEKKFIPQSPRGLSPRLLELAPFLRSRGIVCEKSETVYQGYQMVSISKIQQETQNAFAFLDK
jgi:hypothetical protein